MTSELKRDPATGELIPDATLAAALDAAVRGDLDAVRAAVEAHPELVLARSPSGEGPIHAAHYHGQREVCDYLFAHGQPHDVMVCVSTGDLEGVRAHLDADPELVRAKRPMLLHQAVFWGYPQIARLILERGADPNGQTEPGGFSPYHSATAAPAPYCPGEAEENVLECVELLLAAGADPNLRSSLGVTTSFNAAANGDLRVLRRLIEAGSDPWVRAVDNGTVFAGKQAVDIARDRGRAQVVAYLEALAR